MMSANSLTDKKQKAGSGVLSRFLALEPRVLLDAAAADTALKVADAAVIEAVTSSHPLDALADAVASSAVVSSHAGGGAPEILFVDASIDDFTSLIADLGANVEVHVLEGGDWAGQIQAALGRREGDVAAIHIVTHGQSGKLQIGGTGIDAGNMQAYAPVWSAMRQALSAGGDILIYGCNVAEGEVGAAFVQALAAQTGADVAASDDLSGVAVLGGDWDLEVKTGAVEAHSLYSAEKTGFTGLLADGWVQDTEISAGTSSVSITRTADGNEFKFVGRDTAGHTTSSGSGVVNPNTTTTHGQVDIYKRNVTTGVWEPFQILYHDDVTVPSGFNAANAAKFGAEVVAAGDKVAISAPTYDPNTANAADGRVFVYTWNGTTWKSTTGNAAIQVVEYIPITGSGQSGESANINITKGTADQWGYSLDMATDGNGNYRLVISNPFEDWWDHTDATWTSSASDNNVRQDMGAAVVLQASSNGQFGEATNQITQIYSQTGGTASNAYFGSVVAVGYDAPDSAGDPGHWWVAVGAEGIDQVRMYLDPAANTTINGSTWTQQFSFTGAGRNAVTMDDDWMVIANSASMQAYKLTGTTWATAGASFGSGSAVIALVDRDYSYTDSVTNAPRIIYSGVVNGQTYTYVIDWDVATNTPQGSDLINSGRQELAVAIDPYRAMDVLVVNASGAQSWHYNWDPDPTDDELAITEDNAAATIDVIANDTDLSISGYGTLFGDTLTVSAVGASAYNATVTFSGRNVTYNAQSSAYLQTLALGQTVQDLILVTVTDGQGGFATGTLRVTITGTNDAPIVSAVNPLTPLRVQQAGSTASYDLSAYFTDIDQGEAALLEPDLTSLVLPSGWSATKNGALLLITIPAGAAHNSNGTITVRMQDPQGATSTARSFVINVDALNDPPVVQNPILDQVAIAQYGFSFQIPENTFFDADPAPYDVLSLTYTATLSNGNPLPAWLTFDAVNRQFTGTPAAGDVGLVTIRVTASDGSASVSDDFAITIVDPAVHTAGQVASGTAVNADFGFSMAISNDGLWMVVGSPGLNSSRGAAYVYEFSGGNWVQRSVIQASDGMAGDKFGWSVAISDNGAQIVVGARQDGGAVNTTQAIGAGSVYCYTRSGSGGSTAYGQEGKLQVDASIAKAEDFFGTSVAINGAGTSVLIGASHFDANGSVNSGAAFLTAFKVGGTVTNLTGFITPKDASDNDRFGTSVAFDQNILVVSAMADDNPSGMVSRIAFDDGDGINASATFGSVTAALANGAQFYFDATRGNVLQLTGTGGMANLSSAIDLGTSWTISAWYNMGATGNSGYRTLTSGSSDQQIIIKSGSNELGVWNGSTTGNVSGFNPIGTGAEVQQLVVKASGGNFTLKVGSKTTGNIVWNATDATLRNNIQSALDATLGSGFVTVAVTGTDTFSLTFNSVSGNMPDSVINIGSLTGTTTGTAFTTLTQGTNFSLTTAQLTGWHLITAVGEGGQTTFYIDGVKVGVSNYQATDDITVVGNYQSGGRRFADYIDDFRVHDRALTASEIRNIYQGVGSNEAAYTDAGSLYVFSTSLGNAQVAKLYAPDGMGGDLLGWAIDVDVFDAGGTNQSGIIVATSLYNDQAVNEGGAVYIWRSSSLQSGSLNNGGAGNGTWQLETKLTPFDVSTNAYSGNDVAVDYDEVTGGTRLVVGAPFDDANGSYSGAVYAYKYQNGVWLPEKFVDGSPQGGSMTTAAFFGNAVDVAGTRAVFGSRYRDSTAIATAYDKAGAAYSVNLLTQGTYTTTSSIVAMSMSSFVMSEAASMSAFAFDTSETLGELGYDESGRLVYSAGDAFASLGAGETAVDTFTYFTEQGGVTYANRVMVTVRGSGEAGEAEDQTTAASVASNDVIRVSADGASVFDVLANDFSASGELTLLSVQAPGIQGLLQLDGNKLRYDPQGKFDALRAGEAVQQSFSYVAVDADGNEVSGMVTLVVEGVDDAVIAAADQATVAADASVLINVLANDSDRDGEGTFWVSYFDASAMKGSITYNGDGSFTYVPGAAFSDLPLGETATDRLVYVVRDASGNEYSALLTITVTGVHEGASEPGPVQPGSDIGVTHGTAPVVIPVGENDGGGSIEAVNSTGTKGVVTVQGDGSILYAPGSALAMLPAGSVYVDRFSYSVRYADGSTASVSVSVYVNGEYVTSRLNAEEEDEQYFASFVAPSAINTDSAVPPTAPMPAAPEASSAGAVADMALDGLLEMADAEEGGEVPAGDDVLPDLALQNQPRVLGKPTLSAMLERERAARHSDIASLLRSLA